MATSPQMPACSANEAWSGAEPPRGQREEFRAKETGTVVKVQGTVTAVDQAGAKFAVTGPWDNHEDLLPEGAPVYLEPDD